MRAIMIEMILFISLTSFAPYYSILAGMSMSRDVYRWKDSLLASSIGNTFRGRKQSR
jgi:hypothetical protein